MSRPILLQEVEMGFSSSEDWMKSTLPRLIRLTHDGLDAAVRSLGEMWS